RCRELREPAAIKPRHPCLPRIVKKDKDLFFGSKVGPLHHDDVFEAPYARHIKLKQLTNCFCNHLPIASPKKPERFVHCPPNALNHEFYVHVIRAVCGRDVNRSSLTSKLVDCPQHSDYM